MKNHPNHLTRGLPPKQGLYDPRFERDACGVGFIVDIKGRKSHDIIRNGLTILHNLDHRGACGCEPNTGDGAGILFQIPHKFFAKVCAERNIKLPKPGQYGVGMVYLPPDPTQRRACEIQLEKIIKEEGQEFLGWRTVPTNDAPLGSVAKSREPVVRQIFIGRNPHKLVGTDDLAFERKLYVIRRRAENVIRFGIGERVMPGGDFFYFASLSCRTIVYKGMLLTAQVDPFYPELEDEDMESALALVHSRFSTNTFPSWERAHPYRYIIHNGEINTLRGNENWMTARQSTLVSPLWGDDIDKVMPIIDPEGSDSAKFDNCLEFLHLSGRSLAHAILMMIPEPWSNHKTMDDDRKAFYEYHATQMEPWDGPASIAFTDGTIVGAILDRNGLRPSRYYVTKDDKVIMASEVGVLDIPPENVLYKSRLEPGRMFLVDTKEGRIIADEEFKQGLVNQHPYREWLDTYLVDLNDLPDGQAPAEPDHDTVMQRQQAFGYTFETLRFLVAPMAQNGIEALGAMGDDTPVAILSDKSQLLYNYFRQLFAQVTNPPLDAIREELVTATEVYLGTEQNLLADEPEACHQIKIKLPLLTNEQLAKLRDIGWPGFKAMELPMLFKIKEGAAGLEKALENLFATAKQAMSDGYNIFILSDRGIDSEHAPIPALLATGGLHHYLIREQLRTQAALIVETGEAREVHHFSVLIGYGATAINPYLAYESIDDMIRQGMLNGMSYEEGQYHYIKAANKGVVKVLSKMGISTMQSYCGAQIFEALGLSQKLVDKYFTWTPTRIEGIDLPEIYEEVHMRHQRAFPERSINGHNLEAGGAYQWRADGERHLFNPQTIHKLQLACRTNNFKAFQEYTALVNNQTEKWCTLRGLLELKLLDEPIPLDEVESVESIVKRFKTGAMSYGSISKEAHESLAIAMNRIGGKSNTGEGGEDPDRYTLDANGDSRNSAIKQVASGRFGVTSKYLVEAQELQIKMAQGAKPGEGGQLPGRKVYPWIAKTRHSTPGVGLISPPPHHDIYSIEDLAELIHDLKNANHYARINVKLVSEVGVGTVAAGVAKGHADVILISGHDGGTGASPQTSIKHAGLPWELGVAETHQTLVLNDLRSRVVVETDGQLKTGRDVVIATLLGAEEFGFATSPLVALGCIMMRVCHLDTCPVGVATQNPELRKKFTGDPQHVVNFMYMMAQDMREWMAKLGFRTINEMIGRTDKLEPKRAIQHWKAKGIDLSALLYQPDVSNSVGRYCQIPQDHGLEKALDNTTLLELCKPALDEGKRVAATVPIRNVNRVVGTILGSEVTRRYGADGLPEDTIELHFQGSAGQSFGAFVPKGLTLELEGDGNDYFGKGLSGGKLIVYPPKAASFVAEDNIIVGNVAFYGATAGEAYIRGLAGERFCVRNSGVHTVVEGVGDHGCEYMTGGRVVVLGPTGRNFAAGMSGGIAYVLDHHAYGGGDFDVRLNTEMVEAERLTDANEIAELQAIIQRHLEYTGSTVAQGVLENWDELLPHFVKVMPTDYKRMLEAFAEVEAQGLSGDDAAMAAFELNKNDLARVTGN
ncbi:MAG: glutamate synthase large subunit [Caldilineaceae bacterium]|nr:glutamate synthase large subunit [Caldilineaceae bacterium]